MRRLRYLIVTTALSAMGLSSPLFAECLSAPAEEEYALSSGSVEDSPREAFKKAEKCLAALAIRFAGSSDDTLIVAQAIQGGCQEEINHASARTQMAITAAGVTSPPPDGFFIDLPPCLDGTETCKPWERRWTEEAEPLAAGTVVGSSNSEAVSDAATSAAERIRQDLGRRAIYWVMEARACAADEADR